MKHCIRLAQIFAVVAVVALAGCEKSAPSASTTTPAPIAASPAANTAPAPVPAPVPQPVVADTAEVFPPKGPNGTRIGPRITFAKATHDFGTIWDVKEQTCSFAFTIDPASIKWS